MKDNEIQLLRSSNRIVVNTPEDTRVYQYDEENVEGLRDFLYDLLDDLGYPGSRYDHKRVFIRIEHGDKYECKDSKCQVCEKAF